MTTPLDVATQLFLECRFEEALVEFDKALETLAIESHPVVHANRGAVLMSLGDVEAAVKAFDQALALDPEHVESLHNKGVALVELDKQQEALACFDKVCLKQPDFYAAHCGRSEALARLGRFQDSLKAADVAVPLEPDTFTAHVDRAYALLKLRKFGEAVTEYETAMALGDDSAETQRLYGVSLSQEAYAKVDAGDAAGAVKLLDKSLEISPSCSGFHNRGVILIGSGREKEALESFERAVAENDEYIDSHAALGVIYTQNDATLKQGTSHLERACALDDSNVETRYNLGIARIKAHNVDSARSEWEHVLKIQPGEPHATDALKLLDAALAEAKAKGSDGKAEMKNVVQKISAPHKASTASPEILAAADKALINNESTMDSTTADRLLASLEKFDAALAAAIETPAQQPAKPSAASNRRKSVLESAVPMQRGEIDRSFVRDISAGTTQLRKGYNRGGVNLDESKITSALSKLNMDESAMERRKSNMDFMRGTAASVAAEEPHIVYLVPGPDTFLPYSQLKNRFPEGVDPRNKEMYLANDDFKKVFGKTKDEVTQYPAWKLVREKKRLGLF